jgi:hypothetical protein
MCQEAPELGSSSNLSGTSMSRVSPTKAVKVLNSIAIHYLFEQAGLTSTLIAWEGVGLPPRCLN